ncbi:MAG TPA: AfsR/SARP family transcriptional regulator [Gaiellaceae bacterium]|nr:AfsR/SARP family transcriptional regulator [Gaiellaceae bacterium]
MVEFRILGPLEAVGDDGPIRLGGPRQRATLALLLLHANRVVSIERLADDLYAGRPPVTAVTQVQRQVSDLRKVLGASAIETRPPGYVLHVDEERFDLARFERLTSAAERESGAEALGMLREALALWRGPPLADLEYEPFTRPAVNRLEELRLATLEARIELDLELGRPAQLVAELEAIIAEHPLRERPRALQMRALYRAGRQADALSAYRDARRTLVEELGIEPSPELKRLERSILDHEPSVAGSTRSRTVVVAATSEESVTPVLALATGIDDVELVVVRLVAGEGEVADAARSLAARRIERARTAAFTTTDAAADVARLARAHDAELVLVDTARELEALSASLSATVALVAGRAPDLDSEIAVPFGGSEHDWAALELAAQLGARSRPIRLIGMTAHAGRRDSSRLLADASLALQRFARVEAIPVLTDDLLTGVTDAGVVLAGVSSRFRTEGVGPARRALLDAGVPLALVHRGPRPGALAPIEERTRYTWTLASD